MVNKAADAVNKMTIKMNESDAVSEEEGRRWIVDGNDRRKEERSAWKRGKDCGIRQREEERRRSQSSLRNNGSREGRKEKKNEEGKCYYSRLKERR